MDVVGLFLVDPQNLIHGTFKRSPSKRESRELFTQVVAVTNAKLLYRVCRGTVFPVWTDLLANRSGAMFNDI